MAELATSLQSATSENSPLEQPLPTRQFCFPTASLEKNAGFKIKASLDYATALPNVGEIEDGTLQQDPLLLTTAEATQDYRAKAFELMTANVKANMEYANKLRKLRTPFEFIELSTIHARRQFELIMSQTAALGALSRSLTKANAERIFAGLETAFGPRKT